jgi:hypothetical protein
MPWPVGPVTFAAVIVPVIFPEVVAGQAGWPPPPHKNIITPPATLVGAKCRCETLSADDKPEKLNENVIIPSRIVMSKSAVPAELIGGTSFAPARLAEKCSVCEGPADATSMVAISAVIIKNAMFLSFIMFSSVCSLSDSHKNDSSQSMQGRTGKVTSPLLLD